MDDPTRREHVLDSDIWLPESHAAAEQDDAAGRGEPPPRRIIDRRPRLAFWLFVATAASMFAVGMLPGRSAVEVVLAWEHLTEAQRQQAPLDGLIFAAALLAILGAHEMGHYLQSRRYHVPATLPFFIPLPISPFGTMGAVILQDGRAANRKMLFDIAVSGPLAGLVLAIPIAWFGIQQAEIQPIPVGGDVVQYGNPLIIEWLTEWIRQEPIPAGYGMMPNPLFFAGWVGIFITALNLLPVGQLDGGHILYTLVGRRAHVVALGVLALGVAYMVYASYYAYIVIVLLLMLMGPKHPPTANDHEPMGPWRHVIGWLTLAFIVIGFTPMPIVIV